MMGRGLVTVRVTGTAGGEDGGGDGGGILVNLFLNCRIKTGTLVMDRNRRWLCGDYRV